jgi:hypothetical protein
MQEYPVGDTQLIVTYRTHDWDETKGGGYSDSIITFATEDAAQRARDGWRIVSWDALTSGFSGSAGNLLFNSGGGFVTDVAITVVYARVG